jgi:PAS domain-containing protein
MRENPNTKTGLAEEQVSRQKDQQGKTVSGGGVMIYRSLAECSGDPIFLYDREGLFIYANRACARSLGCEPSHMEGRPLTYFFPDEVGKEMLNHSKMSFARIKSLRRTTPFAQTGIPDTSL